eukprot:Skav230959  [mRNA]  locus=scaffold1214:39421:44309:- [translate_table: standard]
MIALLLLLQSLCSSMDWKGFAISTKHQHLERTWLAVLGALLETHLDSFLEVDGVAWRAAYDELPVHEKAFAHVTALFLPRRHDEAEALLRVPLVDSTLYPGILLLLLFGWRLSHGGWR